MKRDGQRRFEMPTREEKREAARLIYRQDARDKLTRKVRHDEALLMEIEEKMGDIFLIFRNKGVEERAERDPEYRELLARRLDVVRDRKSAVEVLATF